MAWRMNYIVTTLPRATAEVARARIDWEFDHKNDQGGYETADPQKVGRRIASPVVRDNRGKEYLCELVETHYNRNSDELIFIWKPTLDVESLSDELKNVPDRNPMEPVRNYAGE